MTEIEQLKSDRNKKDDTADRPIVWALQHIETYKLAKRDGSVILCPTEEDIELHIRPLVSEPSNWRAVGFIRGWWDGAK